MRRVDAAWLRVCCCSAQSVAEGKPAADGPEKAAELMQRAALSVKALLQDLEAPGKRD